MMEALRSMCSAVTANAHDARVLAAALGTITGDSHARVQVDVSTQHVAGAHVVRMHGSEQVNHVDLDLTEAIDLHELEASFGPSRRLRPPLHEPIRHALVVHDVPGEPRTCAIVIALDSQDRTKRLSLRPDRRRDDHG